MRYSFSGGSGPPQRNHIFLPLGLISSEIWHVELDFPVDDLSQGYVAKMVLCDSRASS